MRFEENLFVLMSFGFEIVGAEGVYKRRGGGGETRLKGFLP